MRVEAGPGSARAAKAKALRAMRVLETAVGVALGPAEQGQRTDLQPSLMSDSLTALPRVDRHRFRLMAERREVWWRELAERPLSRIQARAMRRCGELLRQIGDDVGGRPKNLAGAVQVTRTSAAAEAGLSERPRHPAPRDGLP